MSWGVKDDLKTVQNTLETILAKIVDAEQKQEKNVELSLWLKRLKDIAYEADDLLDSFSYKAMMRQHERGGSVKNKVLGLVSSSNPLAIRLSKAMKLRDIKKRLDVVANDMGRFQLQSAPSNTTTIAHDDTSEQLSRQTMSSLDEMETLRSHWEDDKNEIMKILTSSTLSSTTSASTSIIEILMESITQYKGFNSISDVERILKANYEKVAVISVVGVGGLGKTTLAQLVYRDPFVKRHFDLTIWVCVSGDFEFRSLLIKIMASITENKDFNSILNVDVMEEKVREELTEKKYLLVLDDLCDVDDERWARLKSFLAVGAQGSRVLITTRRIQVADVVKGSIPPYKLKHLEDDECWSIIAKKAFSHGGATKTSEMTNIGSEIAKRCGGLPLAAKFLGSLMHSKTEETDWLSIQENDIWNSPASHYEVIPAIRLSYNNLSWQLKLCFSYCSLFPKDRVISRETLIQLWMAEGFLDSYTVQTNRSIEDAGNENFKRLLESSFLDGVEKNVLGDVTTWTMHDLVHDFAQAVAGNGECVSLKVSELNNVSQVRRLELTMDEELSSATYPETFSSNMRTLIVLKPAYTLNLDRFSSNKHLRVLHLGPPGVGCSDISYSDSNLKHLRYLNLQSMNFSVLTKIAESITRFYNLQTLVLKGSLHVQDILRNIQSLQNLRHLDISRTDIKELPDSVTSLCNLQGLDLSNCMSLTLFPSSASGLKYLRFLDMSVTPIEELPGFVSSLHNLQTLDLNKCSRLRALPEYVTSLKSLRIFNIEECTLLETLPTNFGALTHLRSLNLSGTDIKVLPDSCVSLENLEILNLFICELPKEVRCWKKLRDFKYTTEETPTGIGELVCLQKLFYRVKENGIEEIGNLKSLQELLILDVQNVKDPTDADRADLQRKQKLRYLGLYYGLEDKYCSDRSLVLEALQPPTDLRILKIVNYMGPDIPTWMRNLPNLEQLEMENCDEIIQLPAAMGLFPRLRIFELTGMSLTSLDIGFPSLNEVSLTYMFHLQELRGSCPLLQSLKIVRCTSLNSLPSFPSLHILCLERSNQQLVSSIGRSLNTLTRLFLVNIEQLIIFPVSIIQNNPNLALLSIDGCEHFQGFMLYGWEDEVALFGSLQRLLLMNCPVLKYLPDLQKWNSLRKLTIYRCPQLLACFTYDLSFLKECYYDIVQARLGHGDVWDVEDMINLCE